MIHGIYYKTRAKNKWHLFSVAASAETASSELKECKKQASVGGDEAQVVIKIFDTVFYIPEYLSEIVENKPSFN
jgi:hypothetical protein